MVNVYSEEGVSKENLMEKDDKGMKNTILLNIYSHKEDIVK